MTWVKLDDGFPDHPNIALLSVKARWVFVKGLCYCARYLTDGHVPRAIADRWEGPAAASELVKAQRWSVDGADYVIRDYLDWNPSRAEVEERRRVDSARKATRNPPGKTVESLDGIGEDRVSVVGVGSGEGFDGFYAEYPRHEGRRKAEPAYERALQRAPAAEIIAGARRYRDDPNREAEFTAHPATWLNRDGWEDAPLPARSNGRPDNAQRLHAIADRMREAGA